MNKFKNHDCMDARGTIPRKESVESSLEQRPRAKQEVRGEDLNPKTKTKINLNVNNEWRQVA